MKEYEKFNVLLLTFIRHEWPMKYLSSESLSSHGQCYPAPRQHHYFPPFPLSRKCCCRFGREESFTHESRVQLQHLSSAATGCAVGHEGLLNTQSWKTAPTTQPETWDLSGTHCSISIHRRTTMVQMEISQAEFWDHGVIAPCYMNLAHLYFDFLPAMVPHTDVLMLPSSLMQ